MDGSRICLIDIYAIDDDFDFIIQSDLTPLECLINKELSFDGNGTNAKTIIRLHNVAATSSTLTINFYVMNESVDLINDTDIVDFINDELVEFTKTPFSLVICKQNGENDNICFLENQLQ